MRLISVALFFFFALPAMALQTVPSTRDILLTGAATANFAVPGGRASFVSIKNDCADDIYFDIYGISRSPDDTFQYPIRLKGGESFSMTTPINSVGASPAGALTTCTFTIIFGR